MVGRTIDELALGDRAEFSKTISESDVYRYAELTGDNNPAHVDEAYARTTFFKTRIAHGMLVGGLISTILGSRLPGFGTIYLRQELNFVAPVHLGDTITASAEVVEIIREKNRVRLKTLCTNQDGLVVVEGQAVVSPPKAREGRR